MPRSVRLGGRRCVVPTELTRKLESIRLFCSVLPHRLSALAFDGKSQEIGRRGTVE